MLSFLFFLMIRRPPRSTRVRSSAASDVYKRQVQRRALPGSIGLGHAKDAAAKPCRQQQSRHAPPGCKGARIARRKPTFDTALERRLNGELAGRARGQACKRTLRAGGVELANARRPHVWSRASPAASEAEAAYRTSSSHHTNTQVTHRAVSYTHLTLPTILRV